MAAAQGNSAQIEQLCKVYRSRLGLLTTERDQFTSTWRDIRDFIAPRTARFKGERVNDPTRQDLQIINTSPRFAYRALAAGMQSGVTSPLRPWFRLGTPDPDLQEFKPVKLWLGDVERLMRQVMSRSNMYDRLKSNYGILGGYGTSAFWVDDDEEEIIRTHDLPVGSFMLATNAAGRVDTLYRETTMTVVQMVQRFGIRAPQSVREQYDRGQYDNRYELCHIVEPNRLYDPTSYEPHHKQVASVWFDPAMQGMDAMLGYKGYDDTPMMCPRWDVTGEDTYGQGCGELALGDARQLQLMEKRKLQGIDKNVNPPMVADASMRNQRTSVLPGETTYVNGLITGKPGYKPAYQVNPYINEMREEIAQISARVDEAFFKNLFLMISEIGDQPNITATQINTMREEKLMMLGPVLERLNDELLNPLIDKVFNAMQARGVLPPPPEEIQGQPLKVEYISVLAQAQKAMGIGNIERLTTFVVQLAANTQNPEPLDKLNLDEAIDEYADGVATPPRMIRSDDETKKIREGRAQQQQAAQTMQAMQQGADAMKTASDTNLATDNPITRAMNIANGPT